MLSSPKELSVASCHSVTQTPTGEVPGSWSQMLRVGSRASGTESSSHGQVYAGFPTLCSLALQCRKIQFSGGTETQDSFCGVAQVDAGLLALVAQYSRENYGANPSLPSP